MLSNIVNFIKKHDVILYFILAYALSWSIALPLAAIWQGWVDWHLPMWLHFFISFGPMLSALLITALTCGIPGLRDLLGRIFSWRFDRRYWLAVVSPLLVFTLLVLVLRVLQGYWMDLSLLGEVHFLPNLGGWAFLLWLFTFGLGEEIGWRGFALPRLQQKYSALAASRILWALWALWHLPMFFYIYEPVMLPVILISMFAGTVFLTWLFNSTHGSLLAVILWHGMYDFITASAAGEGAASVVLTSLVVFLAIYAMRRYGAENLSSEEKVRLKPAL